MHRILMLLLLVAVGCSREQAALTPPAEVLTWQLPRHDTTLPAPRSVHLGHDGVLYILDTIGRVVCFDPRDGRFLRSWFMPETSVGRPEGLCL